VIRQDEDGKQLIQNSAAEAGGNGWKISPYKIKKARG
jgi:hypothetical protein